MLLGRFTVLLLVWIVGFTGASWAADEEEGSVLRGERPFTKAIHVEVGPDIDGVLDDDVWDQAPAAGPLYQYNPGEGEEMTERTEFRILYDDSNIYLGVWCFDKDADLIIARKMERDRSMTSDDYISFVFDTFHDFRNGYYFQINPNGARRDALIGDNVNFNGDWDGLWRASASRDDKGWYVEVALPFKTLSFNPKESTWGFNLNRGIPRKFESGRWHGARRQIKTYNVSAAGEVRGIENAKLGKGIEFSPYVVGSYRKEDMDPQGDMFFDYGFDARYRFTPNLSGSLTYNLDFAETEADRRQINLSRFPLFFPEKRDFFLEDSSVFEFGGITRSPLPFHSRRIGLARNGQVVPVTLAGKVTGRVGDYNIGVLNATLGEHSGMERKNVTVARLSKNVFDQSSVGMITTIGDPNSANDNYVAGTDYRFRTTKFMGDKVFEANIFGLGSYTDRGAQERGYAYGAEFLYPNDLWWGRLEFMETANAFNPALGFVSRRGVRNHRSFLSYRPRPESWENVRQYRTWYSHNLYTDMSNDLDSGDVSFSPMMIVFESQDEVWIEVERNFDRLITPFQIVNGITIPAGHYWWTEVKGEIELASRRKVSGDFNATLGEFYNGSRNRFGFDVDYLPNRYFGMNIDYSYNLVDLPNGSFETHLGAATFQMNFTPDLYWENLVQYDSVSSSIGYNGRLQWEYRPGSKLFFVVNQAYAVRSETLAHQVSDVTLKVGAIFRF